MEPGRKLSDHRGGRDRLQLGDHGVERFVEPRRQRGGAELLQRLARPIDRRLDRRQRAGNIDLGDDVGERGVDTGGEIDLAHRARQQAERHFERVGKVGAVERRLHLGAQVLDRADRDVAGARKIDRRQFVGERVDLVLELLDQRRQRVDRGVGGAQQLLELFLDLLDRELVDQRLHLVRQRADPVLDRVGVDAVDGVGDALHLGPDLGHRREARHRPDLGFDPEQRLGELRAQPRQRQAVEEVDDPRQQRLRVVAQAGDVAGGEPRAHLQFELREQIGEQSRGQRVDALAEHPQRRQEEIGEPARRHRHPRHQGRERGVELRRQRRDVDRGDIGGQLIERAGKHRRGQQVDLGPHLAERGEDRGHIRRAGDQPVGGEIDAQGQRGEPGLERAKIAAARGQLQPRRVEQLERRAQRGEIEAEHEPREEAGDVGGRARRSRRQVAQRVQWNRDRVGHIGAEGVGDLRGEAPDDRLRAADPLQSAADQRRGIEIHQVLQRLQPRLERIDDGEHLAERGNVGEGRDLADRRKALADRARKIEVAAGDILDRADRRARFAEQVERIADAERQARPAGIASDRDLGVERAGVDRQQGGEPGHAASGS